MSKYSIYATKADYQAAFTELEALQPKLTFNLNWKKIKRVSLDELSALIAILKRKLNEVKVESELPEDIITVSKFGTIDTDNLRLQVTIVKDGKTYKTLMQYIISQNSVHHSDIPFENEMEALGIDLDNVRDDIESRKLRIN